MLSKKIILITLLIILLSSCSTLDVHSIPSGAKIFLDEKDTGEVTPYRMRVRNLSHGRHHVTVKKEGYDKIRSQEFEIGTQGGQVFFFWIPPVLIENLFDDLWKEVEAPRGRRLKTFYLQESTKEQK